MKLVEDILEKRFEELTSEVAGTLVSEILSASRAGDD